MHLTPILTHFPSLGTLGSHAAAGEEGGAPEINQFAKRGGWFIVVLQNMTFKYVLVRIFRARQKRHKAFSRGCRRTHSDSLPLRDPKLPRSRSTTATQTADGGKPN